MSSLEVEKEDIALPYHYPDDIYNDVVLMASALRLLKYPVSLKKVPSDTLVDLYPQDEYFASELERYDNFIEITPASELQKYMDELTDTPGCVFKHSDKYVQRNLTKHPIQLVCFTVNGSVSVLANYYVELQCDNLESANLYHRDPEFPWKEVLEKCIVASYQRLKHLFDNNQIENIELVTRNLEKHKYLVDELRKQGVTAINPEQLIGLIVDYYQLAEEHFPEFRALSSR